MGNGKKELFPNYQLPITMHHITNQGIRYIRYNIRCQFMSVTHHYLGYGILTIVSLATSRSPDPAYSGLTPPKL